MNHSCIHILIRRRRRTTTNKNKTIPTFETTKNLKYLFLYYKCSDSVVSFTSKEAGAQLRESHNLRT